MKKSDFDLRVITLGDSMRQSIEVDMVIDVVETKRRTGYQDKVYPDPTSGAVNNSFQYRSSAFVLMFQDDERPDRMYWNMIYASINYALLHNLSSICIFTIPAEVASAEHIIHGITLGVANAYSDTASKKSRNPLKIYLVVDTPAADGLTKALTEWAEESVEA